MPSPALIRLLSAFLLCGLAATAVAAERILSFDSDVIINVDGSLDVTETITVNAEGRDIRRGIFRDFPTSYRDRFNNRVRVDFDVISVGRDGRPEMYTLEALSNGVRIRIGQPSVFLEPGQHTYTIQYRTLRQLGFFDGFDELYWNVTGTGWQFDIDVVTSRVRLPPGATTLRKSAYTGRYGEKGADYNPVQALDGAAWETTRVLRPGEGLTVAIAWPKGIVSEPDLAQKWRWFLRDNRANGAALLGVLAVFGYYLTAWRRYGKDPATGPIIPRFEPPKDLSPAAVRFIWLMSFDRKAYSAALVSMAVKGYLSIHDTGKSFALERRGKPTDFAQLSGGERRIAKHLLLGDARFSLKQKNHAELRGSIRKLRESLETEYELATFHRHTFIFVAGLVLSLGVAFLTGQQAHNGAAFLAGVLVAAIAAALTFLGLHFWGDDADPTFKAFPFSSLPAVGPSSEALKFAFIFIMMTASSLGALMAQVIGNPVQSICFAILGSLNAMFFFLLKRPTNAGREIMDEIEGFRMYLKTAEENRLQFLHPPEKTPALFERFLPYAIALDVENEWADKFAQVLLAASQDPADGQRNYSPRWYGKRSWSPASLGNLGSSLGVAVAASARPPGSSSGSGGSSGGGGFSGGGGGGGGGGGW